jgi:hypothetical protein
VTEALAVTEEAPAPSYALYSLGQIRWMTFLGGPLAATWMLSHNFRKLGQPRRAKWTWSIGSGVLGLIIGLSIVAEQRLGKLGSFSLAIPLAVAANQIAKQTQGGALEAHQQGGGRRQPLWRALLVFVGSAALLGIGTAQLDALLTESVSLEGGHQVTVEGYATKADALRVGALLTEVGFLSPSNPIDFTLGRNRKNWTLEFIVRGDAAGDAETISGFEEVARIVRERAFDAAPGEVRLDNQFGFVRDTIRVDASGNVTRH